MSPHKDLQHALTDQPFRMLPCRLEPIMEQLPELLKGRPINAMQHVQVLCGELERRCLHADTTRRVAQHEAKVDVNHVAFGVKQDVSVVTVTKLKKICDKGVTGERLGKVALRTGVFG